MIYGHMCLSESFPFPVYLVSFLPIVYLGSFLPLSSQSVSLSSLFSWCLAVSCQPVTPAMWHLVCLFPIYMGSSESFFLLQLLS